MEDITQKETNFQLPDDVHSQYILSIPDTSIIKHPPVTVKFRQFTQKAQQTDN